MSNQVIVTKLRPSQNLRVNCSTSDSQLVALENTDLNCLLYTRLFLSRCRARQARKQVALARAADFLVTLPERSHPFPYRTR